MTFKQAAKYIWQYFGLFIVLGIGLIWLIVWGIGRLIAGPTEYWLYGCFANTLTSVSDNSPVYRDFVTYSGYDIHEKDVVFSANMYFDYNRNQARGNEYYNSFIALSEAGTLDFITMYPEQLAPLGQSGRLMSWDMDECAELRQKYADRLIWYYPPEDAEQTEPVPVGIDISDSRIVTEYGIYPENCALGINVNTQRLDAVELFLDFIYTE